VDIRVLRGAPRVILGCHWVPRKDNGVPRGAQGGCWGVPGCSRKDNVVPRWLLGCSGVPQGGYWGAEGGYWGAQGCPGGY